MAALREFNFDGLVGPTHNYGGLSPGNVASLTHANKVSNPREAVLQGLAKMRQVAALGVGQGVLPPQPRPSLSTLRQLGFHGSDEEVLARVAKENDHLLRICAAASAMWTANAATVAPSTDAADGKLHLTPANLQSMFHRALEADTTCAALKAIFSDARHFEVHRPLPGGGQFADEGAANHTRLHGDDDRRGLHLFAWGRSAYSEKSHPRRYPARQTLEASEAVARLHRLDPEACLFPQQAPEGIDAGAFHTDVLAVGNGALLLLHERAFVDPIGLLKGLREKLGSGFRAVLATEGELSTADAISAYPFNSQLLTLPDGSMAILAPTEAREAPRARRYLERVLGEDNPVKAVHYLDLKQSMQNGGGPACLRLRVAMTPDEEKAVNPRVIFNPELDGALQRWANRCYRDRLHPSELADPALARESMLALDELTRILNLGSIYEFQR
jgi:succinylarginine dihydrolase